LDKPIKLIVDKHCPNLVAVAAQRTSVEAKANRNHTLSFVLGRHLEITAPVELIENFAL
jgi:hypothetical protein